MKMKRINMVPFAALLLLQSTASALQCTSDDFCETQWEGSKCLSGQCSNPFAYGCLRAMEETERRKLSEASDQAASFASIPKRACNSNDEEGSEYCQQPTFDYDEIVIHNANWESAIFYSWILQILLMEFLHVPARTGFGVDSPDASFYNLENRMSYSEQTYPWDALIKANEVGGDCSATEEPCVHVLPEVWAGQREKWRSLHEELDMVDGNGVLGKISWYVPKFTAQRYPHFASYHGLSNNRKELAQVFKRPTTWKEYCDEVSIRSCILGDDVAGRYPAKEEEDLYFKEGDFEGHFRHTSQNNCTENTDTCTGHILAPVCTWSTDIDAQTYWNNIALESNGNHGANGGYTYSEMVQIYHAAAATESDVILWWWKPEVHTEVFRNTTAEFLPVTLPEPTSTCRNNRIDPEDRCHADIASRRGTEKAGCDQETHMLSKVIAKSLRDNTLQASAAARSPGYDMVKKFKVDDLDMIEMARKWATRGKTGLAAREVVCEFIVNNHDDFVALIPPGYPRVNAEEDASYRGPLFIAARILGVLGLVYVLLLSGAVHVYREAKVMVYAQVFFLKMVLFGSLLVSISAILFTFEPSNGICSSQVWFQLLGYTLFLVPLIVKIAAINRLMSATKKLRRIKISPMSLYVKVSLWVMLVTAFLTAYQVVDPPTSQYHSFLEAVDPPDVPNTIVTTDGCGGSSEVWDYCILSFEFFLIIFATVLAYQSRNTKSEFNESRSLAIMIYSHFVFVALRGTLVVFFGDESESIADEDFGPQSANISGVTSILLSLDVISALSIYIVPKLIQAIEGDDKVIDKRISNVGTIGTAHGSAVVQQIQDAASHEISAYRASIQSATSIDDSAQHLPAAIETAPQLPEKQLSELSIAGSKPDEDGPGTVNTYAYVRGDSPGEDLRFSSVEEHDEDSDASSAEDFGGHDFPGASPALSVEEEVQEAPKQHKRKLRSFVTNMIMANLLSANNETNGDKTTPEDIGDPTASPSTPTNSGEGGEKTEDQAPKKKKAGLFAFKHAVEGVIIANLLSDGAEIEYDDSSDDEEERRSPKKKTQPQPTRRGRKKNEREKKMLSGSDRWKDKEAGEKLPSPDRQIETERLRDQADGEEHADGIGFLS